VTDRVGFRWVAVLMAAAIGAVLMVITDQAFSVDTIGSRLGLFVTVFLVTGLIAGAWAGRRGSLHGVCAGMLLWAGFLAYNVVYNDWGAATYEFWSGETYELTTTSFLVAAAGLTLFVLCIGFVSGEIGEKVRRKASPGSVSQQ
jgi:hypothetical protein